MLKFLKKSYPFNDDLSHNAKIIFFISLGVLAFLLIFQPIEISTFSKKQIFYLVTGLAVSTFLILSFNLIVLPSLFPKIFNNKGWNIKKEIIWNLWILLAISSSDFIFYSKLLGVFDINFNDIVKIILIAFLPVAVLVFINQERLFKAHLKSAQQLNKKLIDSKQKKERFINFESNYKKDNLIIKSDSLILIKSADNYIEVYYDSDGIVKKQMIRSTLQKAEEVTTEYEFIFRCHRTFILNINHIVEIQGNSQGYKLFFKNIDFPVIVSQKYINEFTKLI
ncbi:MAG: LytTR family transcriptional regulator [Bacteroidales bacterium]|nr:LytTR family transcriptional regulator [Bacteroidales bacterium]